MNISPNPAIEFAQGILEETNGGIELIEILNKIADDDEKANTNDRIAANVVLTDRALGKCPTLVSPNPVQSPDTDSPSGSDLPAANEEEGTCPERSRKVTQIDQSLHDTLGPAPSAHSPTSHSGGGRNPEEWGEAGRHSPQTPEPFDPYSVHYAIQQHILAITNNGQTLRDNLLEIAREEDNPRITDYHRRRAATILINRLLGTNPNAVHKAACPDCRRKRSTDDGSPAHTDRGRSEAEDADKDAHSKEVWEGIIAELKQKEEAGILTPDPNAPDLDIDIPEIPEDFGDTSYLDEEAASFRAEIALRAERRKQWPAIEERRRKKLERIYPSHSEEQTKDPPDQ